MFAYIFAVGAVANNVLLSTNEVHRERQVCGNVRHKWQSSLIAPGKTGSDALSAPVTRGTAVAQPWHSHCTAVAQLWRSHCTAVAQPWRSHCTAIAQQWHSRPRGTEEISRRFNTRAGGGQTAMRVLQLNSNISF